LLYFKSEVEFQQIFNKIYSNYKDLFTELISKQFLLYGSSTLFEIISKTDFNFITEIENYLQQLLFSNESTSEELIPQFLSNFMKLTINSTNGQKPINLSLIEICYFLCSTEPNELYHSYYNFVLITLPTLQQVFFFSSFI
jgi:hypothetical protein